MTPLTPRPALRVPVEVALAASVDALPDDGAGWAYEPKFDGHRMVVLRYGDGDADGDRDGGGDGDGAGAGAGVSDGDGVVLQARSGRRITPAFPDLAEAARGLPAGTVLDGEVVVWAGGRIDFAAVQHRAAATPGRAAALASALPASYAAFDLLALAGADLRGSPYQRRRALLVDLLTPLGPPLQPVPMTTDRTTALTWYETLRATGIEGLVAKRLDQPYPGGRRTWLKLRHSDTQDAVVVGYTGSEARPRALVLVLPGDGTPVVSSPLSPAVRAQAAARLPEADGEATAVATGLGEITYRTVPGELTVEVRQTTTRHPVASVVRVRDPDHS